MRSLQEFIGGYCYSVEHRSGCCVHRGSTGFSGTLCRLPPEFEEVKHWADGPFRRVWKNDAQRAVVTYCEGDINVTICDDNVAYWRELRRMAEFFAQF